MCSPARRGAGLCDSLRFLPRQTRRKIGYAFRVIGPPVLRAAQQDITSNLALHASEKFTALGQERDQDLALGAKPHKPGTDGCASQADDALQSMYRQTHQSNVVFLYRYSFAIAMQIAACRGDIEDVQELLHSPP